MKKTDKHDNVLLQIAVSLLKKINCYQKVEIYKKLINLEQKKLEKGLILSGFSFKDFDKQIEKAFTIKELLDCYDVKTVFYLDENYPELLRYCHNPPFLLYYRGNLENTGVPPIAMVGTRYPDILGIEETRKLATGLAQLGLPIVSGLARGVDVIAHQSALSVAGYTIAVLAGGLDRIYPLENKLVAEKILQKGGALVSEYPPETEIRPYMFPARNRIIAWMTRGVVVVQAPEKSGALITANFSIEENRDVFVSKQCYQGSIGAGTRNLACDGAIVIESSFDILKNWGVDFVKLNKYLQKDLFFE